MTRSSRFLLISFALLAALPTAHAQIFRSTLIGANENPPAASPATGSAIIMLNATTGAMRVNANFTGLTAPTNAAHIHCCVPPTANAGVITTVPAFVGFPLGVTSGAWDRTYDMTQSSTWNAPFIAANGGTPAGAEARLIAGAAVGEAYLNIHSTAFPGGEIRGTLVLQTFAASSAAGTRGAAAALDALGSGAGAMSDALMTLALMTSAQQAAALEKLTPTPSRGAEVVASNVMTSTVDQVSSRLDGLRSADSGRYPLVLAAVGDVRGIAAGGVPVTNGLWLKGFGVESHQGSRDGFAGYKSNGLGLAAGLDRRFAPGLFIGAALSYSDADLKYRDQLTGNSGDVSSTQMSLYGTQDMGRFYIDGMLAYARQKYDSSRNTGIAGIAVGSYDGHQWGARIGGGMPMALSSSLSITPQIRLDWDSINQDAYTETGGGPLALNVASRSADRLRSSLGAQLDHDMAWGDVKTRPFLRAFWHHDFRNNGIDAAASFVGGGASFVTPGQKLDSNTFTLGVGVNFYTRSSFSASLAYDATLGQSYVAHVLQAKARWTF